MSQVNYFVCLSLSLLSPYPSCLRTLPFAPQARASLQSSLLTSSALSGFALSSPYLSGETDLNPIGAMGKVRVSLNVRRVLPLASNMTPRLQVTQLVFALVAPGNMTSNLMAAAISGAGASQAGDMMQVRGVLFPC